MLQEGKRLKGLLVGEVNVSTSVGQTVTECIAELLPACVMQDDAPSRQIPKGTVFQELPYVSTALQLEAYSTIMMVMQAYRDLAKRHPSFRERYNIRLSLEYAALADACSA